MACFGGDEFVILLDEIDTIEGVVRVAEVVLRAVAAIKLIDGHAVAISASIGIGIAHSVQGAAHEADLLLSQADQAMYKAKQHGKGCFRFSDSAGWTPQTAATEPVTGGG
jgi:diguanylate cyclase